MKQWTDLLLERLDAAFRARFDRDAALVFLNDAYQEYILLRTHFNFSQDTELEEMMEQFMETRDLFVRQLVDRYPSNYSEVEQKINQLKGLCETTAEHEYHVDYQLHPAF